MENFDSLYRLGIPEKKIKQLKKKGILNGTDLLMFYPRKYYDYTSVTKTIIYGERACLLMRVTSVKLYNAKKPAVITAYGKAEDGTTVKASWFHMEYLYEKIYTYTGKPVLVAGKIEYDNYTDGYAFVSPDLFTDDVVSAYCVYPVYSKISDMSAAYLQDCIRKALDRYIGQIPCQMYIPLKNWKKNTANTFRKTVS